MIKANQGAQPSGSAVDAESFAKWYCVTCGHLYDEALGDPDAGLAPAPGGRTFPPTGIARNVVRPRRTMSFTGDPFERTITCRLGKLTISLRRTE